MTAQSSVPSAFKRLHHQLRALCGRGTAVVDAVVIVELKAVGRLLPLHEAQLLSYLKLSGYSVRLLINFHVARLKAGIRRMIHTA